MLILGVDPGLLRTGWGIICMSGSTYKYVDSGVISTNPREPNHRRLVLIWQSMDQIIKRFKPSVSVIEKIFVNSNPASSLTLGYCRGAIFLTLAMNDLQIVELSPNTVKKRVTGRGHATKDQVKFMVNSILGLSQTVNVHSDMYDALALALSFTHLDLH